QLPLKTEACFGRSYDAAHLSAHPKQRVTSFNLSREFKADQNLEFDPAPEQEMKDADGEYSRSNVNAYVRFRDRKGVYTNALSCGKGDDNVVRCIIDCDGGSFNLKPSGQSLLLENNGFVVVGGCGASEDDQENEEHVSPGADDKVFRLDSKPFAACLAERAAMAPVWAKLGKPLRVRFKDNETLCFSRSYDAVHLALHPRQTVKRIALLKTKDSKSDPDAVQFNLTFRVETKDGKKFEQKAPCSPDQYAFSCQPPPPHYSDRAFYLTRAGDNVMLRDKHGLLDNVLKTKLGSDDRIF
ncbi:MAG: hypothetical protein ABUL48_06415, partial [Pseudorhodoplanes sp.]